MYLDTNKWGVFFTEWESINPVALSPDDIIIPDLSGLGKWISDFPSIRKLKTDTSFFNPWDIVGIKRKEVASCSVLAWLLDPDGNHGMGSIVLNILLKQLNQKQYRFPYEYGHYCHVSTEKSMGEGNKNRVDILIDAESYYLIIEAKIDAGEQEDQLSRYCKEARLRAGNKPWGVVFLTPVGHKGSTTGEWEDDIYPVTWSALATAIDSSLSGKPNFSREHDMTSECAVIHAIRCFVGNMFYF